MNRMLITVILTQTPKHQTDPVTNDFSKIVFSCQCSTFNRGLDLTQQIFTRPKHLAVL